MGIMGGLGAGLGGFGLMGGIGLIFNIAFWGGIIWLVVWGVRQFSRSNAGASFDGSTAIAPQQSASEILAVRYARGELTRDEYRNTLNELS